MASQFSAVTGRRRISPYVDEINARTPYLAGIYRQKAADTHQAEMTQLEKDRLALEGNRFALEQEQFGQNKLTAEQDLAQRRSEFAANQVQGLREFEANQAFANKNLASREAQAKKVNALGVVGLGSNLWLGSMRNKENKSLLKDMIEGDDGGAKVIPGAVSKTTLGAPTGNVPSVGGDYDVAPGVVDMKPNAAGVFEASTPTAAPGFWDKASSLDTWKAPATSGSTWASGLGGGFVGAEAGEALGNAIGIGGKAEQRVVGGALGGGLTDRFIGGGDIYSNIFAGLLGGATGYFTKGWT